MRIMNDRHLNDGTGSQYSIGKAATASGLTTKAIRYYEQIGLIPKAPRRNKESAPHTGGDRVYGDADIARLRFIHHARLVDLSLADIGELVAIADQAGCPSEHPRYGDVLKQHLRNIDERVNHLLGLRQSVAKLLHPSQTLDSDDCTWTTCDCMLAGPSPIGIEIEISQPRT